MGIFNNRTWITLECTLCILHYSNLTPLILCHIWEKYGEGIIFVYILYAHLVSYNLPVVEDRSSHLVLVVLKSWGTCLYHYMRLFYVHGESWFIGINLSVGFVSFLLPFLRTCFCLSFVHLSYISPLFFLFLFYPFHPCSEKWFSLIAIFCSVKFYVYG